MADMKKVGKYIAVIGIMLLILIFYRSVEKTPLLAEDHTEMAKAVVLFVADDGDTADNTDTEDADTDADAVSQDAPPEEMFTGTGRIQSVTLRVKSGTYKGKTVEGSSIHGYLYGAVCRKGSRVIVRLSEYNGEVTASVFNYDRERELCILIVIFLGLIWLVGGKRGINGVLALVFTIFVVILLYIPMMYVGFSPFLAAVVTVILVTVVTHLLLAGFEKKSIAAMLGTIAGVISAGTAAAIFGYFSHINGYNVEEIEGLIYVGAASKLHIGGMLFSGILISSLGAVMDVAMSIASSLNEVYLADPSVSGRELFQSGITIGRDMIGTMSNTLILAYVGGSLNMVMLIYAYSYQMHQILNMYSIGIEIMRGVAGTIGIILAVPFTSFISVYLLKRERAAV